VLAEAVDGSTYEVCTDNEVDLRGDDLKAARFNSSDKALAARSASTSDARSCSPDR
jgi:hypothetical protein